MFRWGIAVVFIIRYCCIGQSRCSEKKEIYSNGNSLDYNVILPTPKREFGRTILGRPKEKPPIDNVPGPGQYTIRNSLCSQGAVFGTEKKTINETVGKADNRTSYVDIFPSASVRKKIVGFSFSKGESKQEDPNRTSLLTPGPGYYRYLQDSVLPKPPAFSIGLAGAFSMQRRNSETPGTQFLDTNSSRVAGQKAAKFSLLQRFLDERHSTGFRYHRIIFAKSRGEKPIIKRNIELIPKETKEGKVKKIKAHNAHLRYKIALVNHLKESMTLILILLAIESDTIRHILQNREEADRRRLVSKEKANTWKLVNSWVGLIGLGSFMKTLAEKYNNRKEVRKTTTKFMRILFVCLWSVGKIIMKCKALRMKIVSRRINAVMKSEIGFWRMRRRIKAKKKIAKLCGQYEDNPLLLLFLKLVLYKISRIQNGIEGYI